MQKKKYCIVSGGKLFEVNKEIYDTYYQSKRKERYFSKDLKVENMKLSEDGEKITFIPSREDSLDRLMEKDMQFSDDSVDVEEMATKAIMIEKVKESLKLLTSDELELIIALFYEGKSEVQYSKDKEISQQAINKRKKKVLCKLKKYINL
ncbi:MAG: sigma-70 family RNA polymerase sigma factor [Clostridiales bacterium]|nr:sigma-70 family RNA polymerase sigma factor [Clostridiales bacterium]